MQVQAEHYLNEQLALQQQVLLTGKLRLRGQVKWCVHVRCDHSLKIRQGVNSEQTIAVSYFTRMLLQYFGRTDINIWLLHERYIWLLQDTLSIKFFNRTDIKIWLPYEKLKRTSIYDFCRTITINTILQ